MYASQSLSLVDAMARACRTNGEKRNANRILVGEPEEKRPPRRRWVDILKWTFER
jgi:hypothetical protein